MGIAAALEARAAAGEGAQAERAATLKTALGAVLSGAADSFFWGALRPLAAALAIFTAVAGWRLGWRHPLACGVELGLLVFNAPALAARWAGVSLGLREGEAAVAAAALVPARRWISGARCAAAALIVAAAATALGLPLAAPRVLAAGAFAAGAVFSAWAGGPLRLVAAAGLLGAAASVAGWAL